MKRSYKIVLIIVVVVLGGVGLFLGWKQITDTAPQIPDENGEIDVPTTEPEEESEEGETTTVTNENIPEKISQDGVNVFSYWLNPEVDRVDYMTESGQVFTSETGPDPEVSAQTINALNKAERGPDQEKILVSFGDPTNPRWGIFDVLDGVWRPLPGTIRKATWGINSDNLIGIIQDGNERNLGRIDVGTSVSEGLDYELLVRDLRLRGVEFDLVSENRLIITEKPSSSYSGRMWELDIENLTLTNLISGETGLTAKWDSSGLVFKFNSPDNFYILNQGLSNVLPVSFQTLPSKCTANETHAYCGVPKSLETTDGSLPESYLQKDVFTTDNIYSAERGFIDMTEVLAASGDDGVPVIDVHDPLVQNNNFYFINRYDGGLYEMELPSEQE